MKILGLEPGHLDTPLVMSLLLRNTITLGLVCKDCLINIMGKDMIIDLIILVMSQFNIILGMDWLTAYHAMLDYFEKLVIFFIPNQKLFVFNHDNHYDRVIDGLLAHIDNKENELSLRQVPIVCEYEDVFQKIHRLPLKWEINFRIDFIHGTSPISMSYYQMVLKEMQELKKKTEEFLSQGFIKLSSLPWGAAVLFVLGN